MPLELVPGDLSVDMEEEFRSDTDGRFQFRTDRSDVIARGYCWTVHPRGERKALVVLRGIPNFPGWTPRLLMTDRAGQLSIVSLSIDPSNADRPPSGGITTRVLRALPIARVELELHRILKRYSELEPVQSDAIARLAGEFRETPRPGRRGRDETFYAEVAKAYVDRLGTPSPVKSLASELSVSASQARNLLYEARQKNLLTESPRGKAGGALTPRAKEILDGSH